MTSKTVIAVVTLALAAGNGQQARERGLMDMAPVEDKVDPIEKSLSELRGEMHALFAEQSQRITFLEREILALSTLAIGLQIAILVRLFSVSVGSL